MEQSTLKSSCKLWNISDELEFVRNVANHIYLAKNSNLYFRFTENSHRSIELLNEELNWMNHLKTCGVHFAHPVASINNKFVEKVNEFNLSVFEAAPGKRLNTKEEFTPQILNKLGEVLAQLHKATKSYQPKDKIRPEWDKEEYHLDIHELVKKESPKIYKDFLKLEKFFYELGQDENSYGLIHADFHSGNFNYQAGKITLFDFDDCVYHWFIYDLAVILWSLEWYDVSRDYALEHLLEGYKQINHLDDYWISLLDQFIEYRHILIYAFCLKKISDSNIAPSNKDWFFSEKSRIEQLLTKN